MNVLLLLVFPEQKEREDQANRLEVCHDFSSQIGKRRAHFVDPGRCEMYSVVHESNHFVSIEHQVFVFFHEHMAEIKYLNSENSGTKSSHGLT